MTAWQILLAALVLTVAVGVDAWLAMRALGSVNRTRAVLWALPILPILLLASALLAAGI